MSYENTVRDEMMEDNKLVEQGVLAVLTSRFAAIVSGGPDPIVGVARCARCTG